MRGTRIDRLVSALALSCVLTACATARQPAAPDPYREVNRSLRGERAIVEIEGGEVVPRASNVRLGVAETSWSDGHRTRRVETDRIARVIVVQPPSRGPAGAVLLIGLALSLAFDDVRPAVVAVDLALDDLVWGAPVAPSVGRVVYAAPADGF